MLCSDRIIDDSWQAQGDPAMVIIIAENVPVRLIRYYCGDQIPHIFFYGFSSVASEIRNQLLTCPEASSAFASTYQYSPAESAKT